MPDLLAERVHGVEIVLGKRKGSGRGAGPGIDESRLDHAKTLRRPPDVTPADFHNDVHVGPVVQAVAPLAYHTADDIGDDERIDLDAPSAPAAGQRRARNVVSAGR